MNRFLPNPIPALALTAVFFAFAPVQAQAPRGARPVPGTGPTLLPGGAASATPTAAAPRYILWYRCAEQRERRFWHEQPGTAHQRARNFYTVMHHLGCSVWFDVRGWTYHVRYHMPSWRYRIFTDLAAARSYGRSLRSLGFEVHLRRA